MRFTTEDPKVSRPTVLKPMGYETDIFCNFRSPLTTFVRPPRMPTTRQERMRQERGEPSSRDRRRPRRTPHRPLTAAKTTPLIDATHSPGPFRPLRARSALPPNRSGGRTLWGHPGPGPAGRFPGRPLGSRCQCVRGPGLRSPHPPGTLEGSPAHPKAVSSRGRL